MSFQFWSSLAADPNLAADPKSPFWDRMILDDARVTLQDIQDQLASLLDDRDESREDRVDDFLDWLDDNDIHSARPQETSEKIKGTKDDDVITLTSWKTEKIDGKKGDDLVQLGD